MNERMTAVEIARYAVAKAVAARDVFEILDTPLPVPRPAPAPRRPVSLSTDTIRLTDITLSYPGRDRDALSGVNLAIRPGDQITLAGPSGAGKSSLLALLLRFAHPSSGRIDVGGVDLASVPLDEWRSQIAWVPQDPYLFAASVADNIALGDPAASRQAIAQAARAAGAAEFIEELPRAYDTTIGERGFGLSSGQRQQIALARAILREVPLLLLDEPAAHLDAASAARLGTAIGVLMAGRTVIRVSHAPSPARQNGRVLTLDQGRLTQVLAKRPDGPAPTLLAAPS